jgi:hypothetical protein
LLNRDFKETDMSSSTALLDVDRAPDAPAILRTDVGDTTIWAVVHAGALRSAVVEYGAVLVRGLGLRDRNEVGDVLAALTRGLMNEKKAFASPERHPRGVYSSTPWPYTWFGSGDPTDEDVVALLNAVYEAHTVREPWQAGDLMLVDNMRTAHSREPYSGPRTVLVGMAEPVRLVESVPNDRSPR